MGLYLLNISVDTADPNPESIPEDLSLNDQESIVEIIIEKVLGFKDAIKEYDDVDTEDDKLKKNIKIEWLFGSDLIESNNPNYELRNISKYPDYLSGISNWIPGIDTPPPKD